MHRDSFFCLDAHTHVVYTGPMLKRVNVFLDTEHSKKLASIGKKKGLKVAQLVLLAIAEYIAREAGK